MRELIARFERTIIDAWEHKDNLQTILAGAWEAHLALNNACAKESYSDRQLIKRLMGTDSIVAQHAAQRIEQLLRTTQLSQNIEIERLNVDVSALMSLDVDRVVELTDLKRQLADAHAEIDFLNTLEPKP